MVKFCMPLPVQFFFIFIQFLGEFDQTIDWSPPPPSWHPRSAAALYKDGITTIGIQQRTRILNTEKVHNVHFKLAASILE